MNRYIAKVFKKIGLLDAVNISVKLLLNGKEFKIPIHNSVGYSNLSMSEPWMIDILKILTQIEGKHFIDVGVNTGQTLLKLRSVDSSIEYTGFEPNSSCINYLDLLIRENNLSKVRLVPIGISNNTEIGKLNFYYDTKTDSSASILSEFRPNEQIERQEFIPLFHVKDITESVEINELSILKIDVEGAELEVIEGFRPLIEKFNPMILIEILPIYNEENSYRIKRQNEIEQQLSSLNYSIYRVIKQNNSFYKIEEISTIGIHSDLDQCDYILAPKGKSEKLKALT